MNTVLNIVECDRSLSSFLTHSVQKREKNKQTPIDFFVAVYPTLNSFPLNRYPPWVLELPLQPLSWKLMGVPHYKRPYMHVPCVGDDWDVYRQIN